MTYQRVSAFEILLSDLVAVLIDQLERAAHLGSAHTLCRLSYSLSLHALFLVLKVPHKAGAGEDEEEAGFP